MNHLPKSLTVLLLSTVTHLIFGQTTILLEDFQGSGIPSGWTQQTNATDGGWKVGSASSLSSQYWQIPSHTNIAATNDDDCDCDKSADRLISPNLDLSAYAVAVLRVDVFFIEGAGGNQGLDEIAQIEVSVNGGSFSVIHTLTGESDWQTVDLDLSAYTGNTNVRIAFRYNDRGDWGYGFAIDNFNVFAPISYDAELTQLDIPEFVTVGSAPTQVDIKGTITNLGATTLTSVDVNWNVNGGTTYSQTIGLNLGYGESFVFTHANKLSVSNPQLVNVQVSLSNLNGSNPDGNITNNDLSAEIAGLGGIVERNVLLEEVSGAWCGWCPLGAYVIADLRQDPNVIAVTIHGQNSGSGDDMEIPDGRTIINTYVDGYPEGFIDRTPFESFGDPPAVPIGFSSSTNGNNLYWNANVEAQKLKTVPVSIQLSNTFNSSTRQLMVDMSAVFVGPAAGNYRVNVYIVEDYVTGTGSGYNQQNYVSSQSSSGGTPGHYYYNYPAVIVGFEHMQVLRAMLGGPWGTAGVIPSVVAFNDTFNKQYTYTLPASWKANDIFLVGIVQEYDTDINERPIVNSVQCNLNSSAANGVTLTFDTSCTTQSITINSGWNIISSYVNPDNASMPDVFSEIAANILLVKNVAGQVYVPALGINNIGSWDVKQGYKVKGSASTTLSMGCEQVDPTSTPIVLASGWNMISYLRTSPMNAGTALAGILSNVLLVKNGAGGTYIPSLGINNIGNFVPGQGYKVRMSAADVLYYPGN